MTNQHQLIPKEMGEWIAGNGAMWYQNSRFRRVGRVGVLIKTLGWLSAWDLGLCDSGSPDIVSVYIIRMCHQEPVKAADQAKGCLTRDRDCTIAATYAECC
jgi:hypothetical protein